MSKKPDNYPYDLSIDEVIVQRRNTWKNKNIGQFSKVILKNGPRTYKWAALLEILNPKDGTIHHYDLKIETLSRTKKRGWEADTRRHISLDNAGDNEIGKLLDFLNVIRQQQVPRAPGDYHVIASKQADVLGELLEAVKKTGEDARRQLLVQLVEAFTAEDGAPASLLSGLDQPGVEVLEALSAAVRLRTHADALEQFRSLITRSPTEAQCQALLEQNPWMFGTEYSELLDRRVWTRDEQADFMLRRTADGFLELIEIKRPDQKLFRYDSSRDIHVPTAALSEALGQVVNYISELDVNRGQIKVKDEEDPLKIRARIVIGGDLDSRQSTALRDLNGHLHRIEVITYDQLVRIADRAISFFREGRAT